MLVSLVFDSLVISWIWLTIRLKTKKHILIRISLSIIFFIINLLVVIFTIQNNTLQKEDISVFVFLIVFYFTFLSLWGLRLVSDLIFFSKNSFEDKEIELSEKIAKRFNLKKQTNCNFISNTDKKQQKELVKNKKTGTILIEKCGFKFFIKYYEQIKKLPLRDIEIVENYSLEEKQERLYAAKKIIDLNLTEFALNEILTNYDLNSDEQAKIKTILNKLETNQS